MRHSNPAPANGPAGGDAPSRNPSQDHTQPIGSVAQLQRQPAELISHLLSSPRQPREEQPFYCLSGSGSGRDENQARRLSRRDEGSKMARHRGYISGHQNTASLCSQSQNLPVGGGIADDSLGEREFDRGLRSTQTPYNVWGEVSVRLKTNPQADFGATSSLARLKRSTASVGSGCVSRSLSQSAS